MTQGTVSNVELLKTKIRSLPVIGAVWEFASRLRFKLRQPYASWKNDPTRRIQASLAKRPKAVIVQIGSNDGKTQDPLNPLIQKNTGWSALFVEPIPPLFERLKTNYGASQRFTFENIAISSHPGQRLVYYLDPKLKTSMPELPVWFDQLGSFQKSHIIKHFGDAIEPHISEIAVETATLPELLDRHQITAIDVLHIDTEGADWLILSQLDLTKIAPQIILVEHIHLCAGDRADAISHLAKRYTIRDLGADFYCELLR